MLSIANISSANAATNYYEKDNYYAKDDPEHKHNSEWYGKGAAKLKLEGQVNKEDFQNVLKGELPNGVVLGRKENDEIIHAPGIDLTFSAPKSISIQAEVYGDKKVLEVHKKSVLKTLEYIEKNFIRTRKMVDGELILEKTRNITAALFQHDVSRNLDPQLHTHCVLANIVERNDKEWRSAFFGRVFENKLLLGQIYRSELAHELTQIGYEIRITGRNSLFELKNIPDTLIKDFSTRSREIAKAGEGYDNLTAKIKAQLTMRTRDYKKEVTHEFLRTKWQCILEEHAILQQHRSDKNIEVEIQKPSSNFKSYIQQKWEEFCEKFNFSPRHIDSDKLNFNIKQSVEIRSIEYAIAHLSERQSVWEQTDLLRHALAYSTGKSTLEKLNAEIQKYKRNGTLLVAQHQLTGFEYPLTTKTVLLKEHETIKFMREGQGNVEPITNHKNIKKSLRESTLNRGQREAVTLIACTKDKVIGIQGVAGAGKTFMLRHAKSLAIEAGYNVRGLAPSASATNTLEKDTGIPCETIHKFLFRYDGVIHGRGTVAGRQKMRADLFKTLMVVDEASLASTSQINSLLKVSKELDFRVVLIGDRKQSNAVGGGKPFEQLQNEGMQTAIMDEIIRQENVVLKNAVYNSLQGDITAAMEKLGKNIIEPTVKPTDSQNERIMLANLAANEWFTLTDIDRQNTLLTAPSNVIREAINNEVRNRLCFEGQLYGESFTLKTLESKGLTSAEVSQSQNYQVGDIVLFNSKYQKLDIKRGEYLSVDAINGDVVILRKESGKLIEWHPSKLYSRKDSAIEIYEPRALLVQSGEQLRWTKNSSIDNKIINSRIVTFVEGHGNELVFKYDSGTHFIMKLSDGHLKHLEYAYASTVHAAQGMTFNNVIGVIESSHPHLTTQKSFYVTLSRAKLNASLITDNKEKLTETLLKQTGDRVTAIEHQMFIQAQNDNKLKKERYIRANNRQKSSYISQTSEKQAFQTPTMKDIYHAMYQKLPQIFPEFGFRSHSGYYVSTTESKIDGSVGKKGKVYVYTNNPGILVDYTRGNKSIWDYVRDSYMPAASKAEMMEYLSDIAGLGDTNQQRELTKERILQIVSEPKVQELVQQRPVDEKLMQSINTYATSALFKETTGNNVLKYLMEERGYDTETIKAMGLGCIDSKKSLGQYLKSAGYSSDKIKEAYKTLHYIGQTHNLVIPYHDNKGEIVGFAARNTNYKETDKVGKYLYTKGLSRSGSLLNIHAIADKDNKVVVVEGLLDALHAKTKGIENVVALGGTAFNQKQLQLLQEHGVKTITLCLDNDKAGKEATTRVKEIVTKSQASFEIKEVTLPKDIKDPDQMIKEHGIESFRKEIMAAKTITLEKPLNSPHSNEINPTKHDLVFHSDKNNANIIGNGNTKIKNLEMEI